MAFTIHVFLKNASFSEEYAQEHHEGNDSPENIRYEWEDEFRVKGGDMVCTVDRNQTYLLSGEQGDGTAFSHEIPDVMIFLLKEEKITTPIVFSEKAVDEYVIDTEKSKLTVILNDDEVVENPIPGIYIRLSDFPKSLRG